MVYNFSNRLGYLGTRFKQLNAEVVTVFTRDRQGNEASVVVQIACPILEMADEQIPGLPISRYEYQDWMIDVADLGPLFPITANTFIRRANGDEFQATPMGVDEPSYRFMTSERTRIKIHTSRTKDATVVQDTYVTCMSDFVSCNNDLVTS